MELKPCPFCGKQPTTRWDISEPHYEEGYNIDCCCVHIGRIFKEDAVEVWNSRCPNQAIHSDGESDAVYCAGCGFTHSPGKCPDGLNGRR